MHLSGLAKTPTTATLKEIGDGSRGTLDTLKAMRALTRNGKSSLPVRQLAASLVNGARQKDYAKELQIIHGYVRDRIRYVRDIRGVETLQIPEKTLEFGFGDCDDKSVLVASMLESIGHPTRFVAMGFRGGEFQHVYVVTRLGNKWIGVECTEPVGLGWTPANVTSRMVVHN